MAEPKHATTTSKGRSYHWDGVDYPSVTSILDALAKPALPRWAAKEAAEFAVNEMHQWWDHDMETFRDGFDGRTEAIKLIKGAPFRKRDDKARLGTIIHEAIESYLNGKDDEEIIQGLQTGEVGYFYSALHFLDAFEPQVLAAEQTVLSKRYGYAGTADIIGLMDGERVVLDFKTSARAYESHGGQVAAYCKADFLIGDTEEKFGGAERGIVVCLREDEEFVATPFNATEWFPLFEAALAAHKLKGLKVPGPLRV